jgi:DNA topoisomerase-1
MHLESNRTDSSHNVLSSPLHSASFFAGMDPDGMHLGNPKTAKIFIKNFFTDFKELLWARRASLRTSTSATSNLFERHLNEQKMIRKAISDGEKKARQSVRDRVLFRDGFAAAPMVIWET